MEVAELKMVRWALGATRKGNIRNEYMRGTAEIEKLGDKLWNARLRWYGHVKRREEDYIAKRMIEMAVPGIRKRGRPKRTLMDLVREDMKRDGAREGDEVDRVKWRLLSRCGEPSREKSKEEEEEEEEVKENCWLMLILSKPDVYGVFFLLFDLRQAGKKAKLEQTIIGFQLLKSSINNFNTVKKRKKIFTLIK